MRPEGEALEHHAGVALVRRKPGHVLFAEVDRALVGHYETRHRSKKRALSATARSEEEQKLTCTYLEVDAIEREHVAEPNDQSAEGDGDHGRASARVC